MKRLELKPDGFPCTLAECPPGFFLKDESVGFKSEYKSDNRPDCYCDSGEYFWGGAKTDEELNKIIVQPLIYEWIIT